jgi:hypothetical protein
MNYLKYTQYFYLIFAVFFAYEAYSKFSNNFFLWQLQFLCSFSVASLQKNSRIEIKNNFYLN